MSDFTTTAYPEFLQVIADLRIAHAARTEFDSPSRERTHVREAALTLLRVSLDLLAQARPEREIDGLTNELVDCFIYDLNEYAKHKRSATNESN